MPFALYELRPVQNGRPVRDAAIVTTLDLADPAGTHLTMGRHVAAIADREHIRDAQRHLLVVEVRKVNDRGESVGDVLFRWALPLQNSEERR